MPVRASITAVALAIGALATLEPGLLLGVFVLISLVLALTGIVLVVLSGGSVVVRRAFRGLGLAPIDPFGLDRG